MKLFVAFAALLHLTPDRHKVVRLSDMVLTSMPPIYSASCWWEKGRSGTEVRFHKVGEMPWDYKPPIGSTFGNGPGPNEAIDACLQKLK